MSKVLAQAGNSLADTYDVEGSVAGIENLETRELAIVHEMGATVFSERFQTEIRRMNTGDLAQNIDFNVVLTDLPVTPARLLGLTVVADTGSRVLRVAVLIQDLVANREVPVWVYDGSTIIATRMTDAGSLATVDLLVGSGPTLMLPTFAGGPVLPQSADQVSMRGTTTGFGAGTVDITCYFLLALAEDPTGLSSRGLPIPSW